MIDCLILKENKMNGILILDLIIIPNTTRIVFYDMNNSHGNWTDV